MKTAMQQLIDHLDPMQEGVKQMATKLLEVEERQLADAYLTGTEERDVVGGDTPYIYESPNKGKTVYKRKLGDYYNRVELSKRTGKMTEEEWLAAERAQTSSQTISDEEIEKAVKNPMHDAYDFREGAKWYREQLKNK